MPVDIKYEPLRDQDIDELAVMLLNKEVYEHIGGTPQQDEFRAFLRRSVQGPPKQRNTERWINYVARHSGTGTILGRLEATVHDGYAEVAYLYGPEHWGNGYATQGLLWLHERLRSFSELRQFWATTSPQNSRSASVLRKCGYFPAPKEGVPLLYSYEEGDLIFTRPSAANPSFEARPTLSSPSTVRRKAEQQDVPFLLQLRARALVPRELAAGVALSSAQQLDRVLAHFESAEVLELERRPVGVIKVIREPSQWKLLQLQLLPEHQRNGIGTQIVQSLLLEAKRAHVPVVLTVLKSNPAKRLYERLGFRVVGEREHVYEMRVAQTLGSTTNDSSDALSVPIAVAMRRSTLLGVPAFPTLTASLIVRRAQLEEAGPLAALLGRAYPTETWDAAGTEHELFGDETIRATLVIAAEGRLIATASLQIHPDAPECGWLRWVATEQDRRREGLARALVIRVLANAEQAGCREARLHTETDRLAAIALYLQLGFEPLVRSDPEREAWEQVIRFLRVSVP